MGAQQNEDLEGNVVHSITVIVTVEMIVERGAHAILQPPSRALICVEPSYKGSDFVVTIELEQNLNK